MFTPAVFFRSFRRISQSGMLACTGSWGPGMLTRPRTCPMKRGSISGGGKIFLLCKARRLALEPTQPPIQWLSGNVSSEVKQPKYEDEYWHSRSSEIKNSWSFTYSLSDVFMAYTETTLRCFAQSASFPRVNAVHGQPRVVAR